MIEQAENVLRDLGFFDVRVRHHELRNAASVAEATSKTSLALARIEVGPREMQKLLADGVANRVVEALKRVGYAHVTVDLQGYRRGSTNEAIKATAVV